MSDPFNEFFKSFFKRKRSPKAVPFIHESIDLEEYDIAAYNTWMRQHGFKIIQKLEKEYMNFLIRGTSDGSIRFQTSKYSNGFVIDLNPVSNIGGGYMHLIYHIQDRLRSKKYVVNLAERKSQRTGENIELRTKLYLKPSLRLMLITNNEKANQLFGNITMEYIIVNDIPYQLRFIAHAYNDRNYDNPEDFGDCMELICVR